MPERINGVPEKYISILAARTAHAAVKETIKLLEQSSSDEQEDFLRDPLFSSLVSSTLGGLDECRREHAVEISGAFAKKHQALVFRVLLGEFN